MKDRRRGNGVCIGIVKERTVRTWDFPYEDAVR